METKNIKKRFYFMCKDSEEPVFRREICRLYRYKYGQPCHIHTMMTRVGKKFVVEPPRT